MSFSDIFDAIAPASHAMLADAVASMRPPSPGLTDGPGSVGPAAVVVVEDVAPGSTEIVLSGPSGGVTGNVPAGSVVYLSGIVFDGDGSPVLDGDFDVVLDGDAVEEVLVLADATSDGYRIVLSVSPTPIALAAGSAVYVSRGPAVSVKTSAVSRRVVDSYPGLDKAESVFALLSSSVSIPPDVGWYVERGSFCGNVRQVERPVGEIIVGAGGGV